MDNLASSRPRVHHVSHPLLPVDWYREPHSHSEFHELLVILAGRNEVTIGGQSIVAAPGDVLLYANGVIHEERADPQSGLEMLLVTFETPPGVSLRSLPSRIHDAGGRIADQVRWMWEIAPASDGRDQDALDALLQVVLYFYRAPRAQAEYELVRRVKQHVREHIDEPIALDDLADVVALSKFHFSRRFRQAADCTPMQFVLRIRIEVAQRLLTTTAEPLKVIAARTGFADAFHFSKTFRRVTGTPPSQWRRDHVRK